MDKHFHQDSRGILHACFHKCRPVLTLSFWIGITASFPLEHLIWERLWPFNLLTKVLGL